MEGCNEVVDASIINTEGGMIQNVSEIPMVIFLPPNQTPEQEPNLINPDVIHDQHSTAISSDVALIQNYR
jgi:hypothetical protein